MSNFLRSYLSKRVGNGYVKIFREHEKGDCSGLFLRTFKEFNITKLDTFRFGTHRYQKRMRLAPGQELKFHKKEVVRATDRYRANFICRYALGLKKTGLPLN